jgi:hypothetical protein
MPGLEQVVLLADAAEYIARQTRELELVMIPDLAKLTTSYLQETDLDYVRWCLKYGQEVCAEHVAEGKASDALVLTISEDGRDFLAYLHDGAHMAFALRKEPAPPFLAVRVSLHGARSIVIAMWWNAEKGQFVFANTYLRVLRPGE